MSEAIGHANFSDHERRRLAAVLDEIIPPSADGRLPGAGQPGLVRALEAALRNLPDLRAMVVEGLADLEELARQRSAPSFAALPREDKVALLSQQAFVLALAMHVYTAYYQQPEVIEALGREARPPHPRGYEMQPNDLSLLDPVRRRHKKLYRGC